MFRNSLKWQYIFCREAWVWFSRLTFSYEFPCSKSRRKFIAYAGAIFFSAIFYRWFKLRLFFIGIIVISCWTYDTRKQISSFNVRKTFNNIYRMDFVWKKKLIYIYFYVNESSKFQIARRKISTKILKIQS